LFQLDPVTMLYRVPAVIIAMVLHEMAHGWSAYLLGDRTAKRDGRLSPNPIRHIDPLGLALLIIVGFGWAKPVMVDPRYFKNPKRGMALTAFAGPLANLVCAFLGMLVYAVFSLTGQGAESFALNFLFIFVIINLSMFIFNMLPVPPLDGSKVFGAVLHDDIYFQFTRGGGASTVIFIVIVLASGYILSPALSLALRGLAALCVAIAHYIIR